MSNCIEAIYSDSYLDYIIDEGRISLEQKDGLEANCTLPIDENFFVVYEKKEKNQEISFAKYGYGAVPKCFGLLDSSNIESTGAFRVRSRYGFQLSGKGVLIGIIDAGIDYTNSLFRYGDGTTRLQSIWDQSVEVGEADAFVPYGKRYSVEDINVALQNENPKSVIPVNDVNYHGTFLAAIAAGKEDANKDFSGMAPDAQLVIVKVKEAKSSLRRFYGIGETVPCYQENDIMFAVRYLLDEAQRMQMPIVICLGMGTNAGSHNGFSPLASMLGRYATIAGVCFTVGAGNEGNRGHHFYSVLSPNSVQEVEINVERQRDMTVELWTDSIEQLRIGVIAPDGEKTGLIQIRKYEQKLEYVFYDTVIYVFYERIEYYSGEEVVVIRMRDLEQGIWKLQVYNDSNQENAFHSWLPMEQFLSEETRFLEPILDTTICNPGNVYQVITFGTYNHRNQSIYVYSGRGFTVNYGIKPDLVAPGVDVYGPVSDKNFEGRSGSSIATAHGAGAVALLFEWAIVKKNQVGMNGITAKNYLLRGTDKEGMQVPNRAVGWGFLDIYQTFSSLQSDS